MPRLGGKVGKRVVGEVAEEIFGKAAKDAVSLAKPAEEFASRSANIYDPPTKPARSIFDDHKVKADDNENFLIDAGTGRQPSDPETGRLLYDPEGRALGERVVGRRMVGGEDVAIIPEEHDATAKAGIGKGHTPVEAGAFPKGVVGKYVFASVDPTRKVPTEEERILAEVGDGYVTPAQHKRLRYASIVRTDETPRLTLWPSLQT